MNGYDLVNDEPLCILPPLWEEMGMEITHCGQSIYWNEDFKKWNVGDFFMPLAFLLMLSRAGVIKPSQRWGVRVWKGIGK